MRNYLLKNKHQKIFWLIIIISFFGANRVLGQLQNDSSSLLNDGQIVSDSLMLQGNVYDPLFLIKGKVAGASVSKNGGHPGIPHHMIIRGLSSIYFSNNPVYVIDNVYGADISMLDPDDIQSMEVLNNISSSARYGNLGGNGVVVVETKFVDTKKPFRLNYNSFISLDQVVNQFDLLSAGEYRDYIATLQENSYDTIFLDGGADVDYQKEMFRNAITHSHHLSGSGSVKNTSYYGSFSYKNQPGVVENSSSTRIGGNLKIRQTFFDDKLVLKAMASYNQQQVKGLDEFDDAGILLQTYKHNPTDPVYNDDGSYHLQRRAFHYFNPVEANNEINRSITNDQLLSNLNVSYAIIENLKASVNVGYSKLDKESNLIIPEISGLIFPRQQETNFTEYNKSLNIEGIINYDFRLKDAHNFEAEAGYAYRNHQAEFLQGQGDKPYKYIVFRREDSDTAIINNSINSIFASLDYNFKQRYYFYGAIRYDALFPSIERKGTLLSSPEDLEGVNVLYPSISLGWKLSNEAFLTNVSWLSDLMIRGGYGEAGKENNMYTLDNNKKLDFERSKEYNIMLDCGFLDNRIFGNLTYYQRTSYNVFTPVRVPVPPNLISYLHDNSVEMANTGFELNISGLVISKPTFSYFTGFTLSSNVNEVTVYPQGAPKGYNYFGSYINPEITNIQQIEEGEALFTFYLAQLYGFADDGSPIYVREDGGLTNSLYNAQRNLQGLVLPSLELGWSNNFTLINNFNFSFSLRYVKGHSIYNQAKVQLQSWQVPPLNALSSSINDDILYYPGLCDYNLEDASYLRLDNIVFSYTINLSKDKPEQKLKLQIGANNLFTITNYTGLDPEINYKTRYPGMESANVYPPIRSYFFGLNLSI